MEKTMKKNVCVCVCVLCVYLNHFAVHQKLTQHCKSTTKKKKMVLGKLNSSM